VSLVSLSFPPSFFLPLLSQRRGIEGVRFKKSLSVSLYEREKLLHKRE
jgi:hypothetical protein